MGSMNRRSALAAMIGVALAEFEGDRYSRSDASHQGGASRRKGKKRASARSRRSRTINSMRRRGKRCSH